MLTWIRDGEGRSATLDLPEQLSWRAHHGEERPPLRWSSAGFGRKEPTTTLVGTGFADGAEGLTTGAQVPRPGGAVKNKRRHWALAAAPLALGLLAATGCESTPGDKAESKAAPSASAASAARSVARVCAKPAAGPAKAPADAVTVDPAKVGDLAAKTKNSPPNTTFWLRPGKHRLDPDRYAQVIPKEGDRYLGAPGAVLDGRKKNQYAFGGTARNVTIRYLTVQRFVAPPDEGVVNHDSADGLVDRARDDPGQLRCRADGRCPPADPAVSCATTVSTA